MPSPSASAFDDTTYTTITVHAHEHGFGAAITGLALNRPLPPATLAEVQRAWARHAVIYFPEQPLTHDELEAVTLQFGEFGVDPFIVPLAEHPHILELRREADEKANNFGAAWHSDWSFQEAPPAATLLHAKVTPPVGGDTLFADGRRAWEALSPALRDLLVGLRAVHSAALPYGRQGVFADEKEKRTMKIIVSEEAEKTFTHPLVRTHPVTGRRSLYASPVYTVGLEGFAPAESAALLGFLYQHMVRPEFIYRQKWRPNMLTVWDNRCTMHNAEGGYDGHLRLMHRTTVAGERPV